MEVIYLFITVGFFVVSVQLIYSLIKMLMSLNKKEDRELIVTFVLILLIVLVGVIIVSNGVIDYWFK